MVRNFFYAIILLLNCVHVDAKTCNSKNQENVVKTLGEEAIKTIGENIPDMEKRKKFKSLIKEYFAVDKIANFSVGRAYKSKFENKEHFYSCFLNMLTERYTSNFADYANAKFELKKNILENTVDSEISINGKVVKVKWWFGDSDTPCKVYDVKIEDVSMATTLKDEIAGSIKSKGFENFLKGFAEQYADKN